MSGALTHSPADIVRQLLVDLGLGTMPATDPANNGLWPVYATSEPDIPDGVIVVTNTTAAPGTRLMAGEIHEYSSVQLAVRHARNPNGYQKAKAIATYLDEENVAYRRTVILSNSVWGSTGTTSYRIQSMNRRGGVIDAGKAVPNSKRSLHTINFVANIEQLP